MALSFIGSGDSSSAERMNLLFAEADRKFAKLLGGGKSFILGLHDLEVATFHPNTDTLFGVPFFLSDGDDCKYSDPIARKILISATRELDETKPVIDLIPPYSESVFEFERNNLILTSFPDDPDFNPFNYENGTVKIERTALDSWADISWGYEIYGYYQGGRIIGSNLFDRSLLTYKIEDESVPVPFNNLLLKSFGGAGGVADVASSSISTVVSGNPGTIYDLKLFFNGMSDGGNYVSGVAESNFYVSGMPQPFVMFGGGPGGMTWRMDISDPPQHFFLNNGSRSLNRKIRNFKVRGNSTITLSYDTIDGIQSDDVNPHWGKVSCIPASPNGDGYYLQETERGGPVINYCQAERTNRFGLAEILVENRTEITLPASGNKYDCYRIHNFNEEPLTVNVGTGFEFSMTPFECRTVRKFRDGWKTGFHYFFPFESGDPRYFTSLPVLDPFTNSYSHLGASEKTKSHQSAYASYSANNLLSPSVLFNWIEAFSTETRPNGSIDWNYSAGLSESNKPLRAMFYQDIDTDTSEIGEKYSGYYKYPITDDTILGDLIHHTGTIKIVKVYDLSDPEAVEFDYVNFNGYSSIVSDFAAKGISVSDLGGGSLTLQNADLDAVRVALIPLSTNLLKSSETIPGIVYLPYTLEAEMLDSSYYSDSWYRHVGNQKDIFQTSVSNSFSGAYLTGSEPFDSINYYETTVGDFKNLKGISPIGATGASSFSNFDFKLTPNGLYCDFDEVMPAYHQLVPSFHSNYAGEPVNWFGEIKSHAESVISETRLQGAWGLSGASLTRKRRFHFRGHGFGWTNPKFNYANPNLNDGTLFQLAGTSSFHSLYSSCLNGRGYLRRSSSLPASGLLYGGRDFYIDDSDFSVRHDKDIKLTQNLSPYLRTTHISTAGGNSYEWERLPFFKQLGSVDVLKGFNEERMLTGINQNYPYDSRYGYGIFSGYSFAPLLSEHYNMMVEKVNGCKRGRPLSADQWWKERFNVTNAGGTQIFKVFKNFNLGYYADGNVDYPPQNVAFGGPQLNTPPAHPKIPLDAYGVLNRMDIYDPYDYPTGAYKWLSDNIGVTIIKNNQGAPVYTGYLQSEGILVEGILYGQSSGSDIYNAYLAPYITFTGGQIQIGEQVAFRHGGTYSYSDDAFYKLKNGNFGDVYSFEGHSPYHPYGFSGVHYLTVGDVSSFFTTKGQEFYWKSTFQPLKWEQIKDSGIYFSNESVADYRGYFQSGAFNGFIQSGLDTAFSYSPVLETSPIFDISDIDKDYGADRQIFPILETWLIPSSGNPTWRTNRRLDGFDIDNFSLRTNRNRLIQDKATGFSYSFWSGQAIDELFNSYSYTGYFSAAATTEVSKRLFNLNYEAAYPTLEASSLYRVPYRANSQNRFHEIMPFGVALYSNTLNPLKWTMIGFKDQLEEAHSSQVFSSLQNYSEHNYGRESYVSSGLFQINYLGTNNWNTCIKYIGEEYGPHHLLPMREPTIDI